MLLENAGALLGIAVAAIGIWVSHATGDARWDGLASVVIGIILGLIALALTIEAKGLLIGEAADPELDEALRAIAAATQGISELGAVTTVHHSPHHIVAGLDVDFDDSISAGDVERAVRTIEETIHAQWPSVFRVFVRPVSQG